MDINQLNIETAIFLRRLRSFSEQKSAVQIDGKTMELFVDIIQSIDKLMATRDMIQTDRNESLDFLCHLDGQHFDLRQHFMCRLCIEQIGVTKDDVEAHVQKNAHVQRMHEQMESESAAENHKKEIPNVVAVTKPRKETAVVCDTNKVKSVPSGKFVESSYFDTTYLIDVKGIPWTATKWNIVEFFDDLNILNGEKGIHFKLDNTYNNDAFIQLTTYTDYHMALKQKVRKIGNAAIKMKEANVDDFMNLVNNPAYPSDQRVLRLKELPMECTEKDIRKYFSGRSVSNVHLIRNDANQFFGEAFVLFGRLEDIELALEGIYGNKIHNKFIKVYRSSKEQFRNYCNAMPFDTPMVSNADRSGSVPNLDNNNHEASDSDETELSSDNGLREVLARGFPWTIKRVDVGEFFSDVRIVGGTDGIDIKKDGAMEARFFVDSDEELRKALSHTKQFIGFRMIYGTFKAEIKAQRVIDNIDLSSHVASVQPQYDDYRPKYWLAPSPF